MDAIDDLVRALRDFAAARDWEQFHSPKNLATALAVESAELLERFQWLTEQQSRDLEPQRREQVRAELADVFLYTLRLADQLGIDLLAAARDKMVVNAERYPVERVRGRAHKYDEYD